jgi:tetratricopeptide (TPR) repeat protein
LIGYFCYGKNWILAGIFTLVLAALLIFIIFVSLPSIYYRKLIHAADWSRWEEVLTLIETLDALGRYGFIKVPATELTRYQAKSLIGMGRLQEGLAVFRPCEGRPDCPKWLYLLFVAGLYDTAKQHDLAVEYNLGAIKEHSSPTAWVDLAYRYAKYKRDPLKAREALAKAADSPLPEVAKPFRIRCLGVIAYLECDYATAKRELETAIDLVEKTRGRPFRDGHLSVSRGYLACVLAKQGDMAGAKKCFSQAKEYLVATKEDGLLAECRGLIGEP